MAIPGQITSKSAHVQPPKQSGPPGKGPDGPISPDTDRCNTSEEQRGRNPECCRGQNPDIYLVNWQIRMVTGPGCGRDSS